MGHRQRWHTLLFVNKCKWSLRYATIVVLSVTERNRLELITHNIYDDSNVASNTIEKVGRGPLETIRAYSLKKKKGGKNRLSNTADNSALHDSR